MTQGGPPNLGRVPPALPGVSVLPGPRRPHAVPTRVSGRDRIPPMGPRADHGPKGGLGGGSGRRQAPPEVALTPARRPHMG